MSNPMYCGDEGCGEQLRCIQVGVWVRDPWGVRAGDVYSCPTCHKETILGASQPVTERSDKELHDRIVRALDTAGMPYVSQQYVVKNH